MIDLSVRGLVKGFEQGNDILKGITFDVNAGERVGILGRNGCGKTTFFRILSGELQPDAGTVSIAAGRRLGLISQIPVYPDGWTTEDVLREAHRRLYDMEARMNELTARMAHLSLQLEKNLPPMPQHLLEKHFFRKHGPGAYYGQN